MTLLNDDELTPFLERLRAAWDTGDAGAFAALFTEDATYVTWLGDPLVGRAAIESAHDALFRQWAPGTVLAIRAVEARSIGPDQCCLLTIGGTGQKPPISYDKLQSFTLVRQEGEWRCAAFHNSAMSARARSAFNAAALPS